MMKREYNVIARSDTSLGRTSVCQTGRRTKVRSATYTHIFFLLIFFVSSLTYAQPLHQGEWKTYTAMSSITDLAIVRKSGNIWAATTGGAFRFSPADTAKADIFALRNSDGLSDNSITAIAADSNGKVYFGGASGTLDVYLESSGKIDPIRDIALATQYARRKIYQISIFGSRIYIATSFGLSIYDTTKNVFTETITKFGSHIDQDTVFAVTEAHDSIYVVLSNAIAVASKNAPNLSAPFAWRIVSAPTLTTLNAIVSFQGKIIAGGAEGIYVINDTLMYLNTGDSISVVRLASDQSTLYVIDSRGGRIKTSTDLQNFLSSPLPGNISGNSISSFALAGAGAKVFGDGSGAGVAFEGTSGTLRTKIFPDGPLANYIADLHYSEGLGKLFVCLQDVGMSVFEPQKSLWSGYGTKEGILPGNNNYTSSFYDTIRSKLWLSTGGGGLFSLDNANPAAIKHYDSAQGIPSLNGLTQGYTIIGKGMLDNHGDFNTTVWTSTGFGLLKLNKDGATFTRTQLNPTTSSVSYGVVVQDQDDIYFVATVDAVGIPPFGVIAVSPPDNYTISIAGGNGQILGSPSVNALIVDQDNGLWCGSNVGVDVLTHSRDFTTGRPKFNKPRRLVFTDQQLVRTIAVDGVGNKWVGTDDGVFVLSADGSDSLAHFTTANSPLIDNSVLSIAIDTKNGEAYIGTTKGISRVSSIYQEGFTDYKKIYVYPNPVIQQSDDNIKVTITGLVGGSTVKIFSASGRLVATVDGSQLGSTVVWNGRDETGQLLTSGVYIAAAASALSTDYGQAKFVLIRK